VALKFCLNVTTPWCPWPGEAAGAVATAHARVYREIVDRELVVEVGLVTVAVGRDDEAAGDGRRGGGVHWERTMCRQASMADAVPAEVRTSPWST